MPTTVQVGTILIDERPLMPRVLGLTSEPYSGTWNVIKALDSFALDRKIHAAGWKFFFMAAEAKALIFGAVGAKNMQNALRRILGKMESQNFNCLEVTGIVAKRFLGVPYDIFGNSRHIQQSCYLDSAEGRRRPSATQNGPEVKPCSLSRKVDYET